MNNKIILNIVLLITTYFVPLYLLYNFQSSAIKIGKIQNPALLVLFLGSALLTFLNNNYRKQYSINKWLWVVFIILGLIGLFYSGFILFLIFATRNLLN